MLVSLEHQKFRALQDEAEERELSRYQDLCIVWTREKTGEVLYKAGGKWDHELKCYSNVPAAECHVIELRESQIEIARWAAYWMSEKKAGRDRDFFSLFMVGDRAGGKTHFGIVFLVTLLIEFPRLHNKSLIAWQVSATHTVRDELDRELENIFPFRKSWYQYQEYPKHMYKFVHGPTLTNISADDAEALKRGTVDALFVNEPQKMRKNVFAYAIGRLKDKGGISIAAANPPTDLKAKWILDLWEEEKEHKEKKLAYPIRFISIDSKLNNTLDTHVAGQVEKIIRKLDPRLAQADLDGMMLNITEPAYWAFNKLVNIREKPDLGDITNEFTKKRTGRAYDFIVGIDFQKTPHMAAAICKVYGTIENPIIWAIDEIVVDQATEDDLIDSLEQSGYSPESLLCVGDASGQWQDGEHKNGRDSFSVFRARRYHIVPPVKPKDPNHRPKNPPIEQRVKNVNALLSKKDVEQKNGIRQQLMLDPIYTPKLIEALKECELKIGKYGRVHPSGFYAHLTDALGYICYWVFPKPTAPKSKNFTLGELIDMPKPKSLY